MNSKRTEDIVIGEIYDMRHDPVFCTMPVKAGTGNITAGQCVKIEEDGSVSAAATTNEMYGISLGNVDIAKDKHLNVLIHGAVKKSGIKVGDAEPAVADIISLKKAGIFVLE